MQQEIGEAICHAIGSQLGWQIPRSFDAEDGLRWIGANMVKVTSWDQLNEPYGKGYHVLEIGANLKPQANLIWPHARITYLDIDPEFKPDIVADAAHLPGNLAGKFDAIFSSHVLEHFSYRDTVDVLVGWGKCLKKCGRVVTIVPSLEWAAKEIMTGNPSPVVWPHLFAGNSSQYDHHLNGFTQQSLKLDFEKAGYEIDFLGWSEYYLREYNYEGKGFGEAHLAEQHIIKATWKGI